MRRSIRDSSSGPLSLFAFQDIIFSVTAVLLFATIWFALSTRVQRFSRAEATGEARSELIAVVTAIAESQAAQRLAGAAASGQAADEAGADRALDRWAREQLAVAEPEKVAAELRDRVQAQEHQTARSVVAMQREETAWTELERRLPAAAQRASEALLRVEAGAASTRAVVAILGADAIEVLTESDGAQIRRISAATLADELRTVLVGRDPSAVWLWIGIRPSATPLFDRLIAAVEATGYPYRLEPIAEDQPIALHTAERARALLD